MKKDQKIFYGLMADDAGFSLLELLVVLSIAVIFLGLCLASYSTLWHQNKTAAVVNQIVSALNETRSQAIMRNTVVTFCGSGDHQHCDGNWSHGQIITLKNQPSLRVYPPLSAGDELNWRGNLGITDYLSYAATGFTNGQNGSFYYCANSPQFKGGAGAIIVVSLSGRVRVDDNPEDVQQSCAK